MALIPYPTPDEMTPEVRHDIETFAKEHGRPTLVRMMLAWFPTALHAMENMYHPIMTEGLLPRRLKELLFVAASNERGCFY